MGLFSKTKPVVGIDIGHSTLKLALVKMSGKSASLLSLSEAPLDQIYLQKNGIKDKTNLSKIIKKALSSAQPKPIKVKHAATAIPESLVYTSLITVPKMKHKELEKVVPREAADFLPLSIDQVNLDWEVIIENEKGIELLVVATPKVLVDDLIEVFAGAGLELIFVETKPIATARAILESSFSSPTAVVDIGSNASGISIVKKGFVKATATIAFGIKNAAANLSGEADNTKAVTQALKPIADEVAKLMKYYHSRINSKEEIVEVIICGGGAEVKGLAKVFETMVGKTTILANPLRKLSSYPKKLLSPDILKFCVAIGLSLRDHHD